MRLTMLVVVLALGVTAQSPFSFDEDRFLDLSLTDNSIRESPQENTLPSAVYEAAPPQARPQLVDPEHLNLPPMPPAADFSFRELLSLARSESSTSTGARAHGGRPLRRDDKFIRELIEDMKSMASMADPGQDAKLVHALQTVKNEIVHKANSIQAQKKWVKQVSSVVSIYFRKVKRVSGHIQLLIRQARLLLRKKKQIDSMIVQRKLEKELKTVRLDLDVIHVALQNLQNKETQYNQNNSDVKSTIGLMEATLRDMKLATRKLEQENAERQATGKTQADLEIEKEEELAKMCEGCQ